MAISKKQSQFVEDSTGEIIANTQEIINATDNETKLAYENNKNLLAEMGLKSEIKLTHKKVRGVDYTCIGIKKDYVFNKIFRVEFSDLILTNKLSKNARCMIGTLRPFVTFPTNAIRVRGEYPTYAVLTKMLDMCRTTLMNTLKELKYYEIISSRKSGRQSIIYFNPFLVCAGSTVYVETYSLFKNSAYNPFYRV